jgi:hypothetical protein
MVCFIEKNNLVRSRLLESPADPAGLRVSTAGIKRNAAKPRNPEQ